MQLGVLGSIVILVLMTNYSHSHLNSLSSINKCVAHQLLNGVTLRNKTHKKERKKPNLTKKPQPHILYHKYAAHKANSVSGSVIK